MKAQLCRTRLVVISTCEIELDCLPGPVVVGVGEDTRFTEPNERTQLSQ